MMSFAGLQPPPAGPAQPGAPLAHQLALVQHNFYPPAEAAHADVLADRALFDSTLQAVHRHFGIAEKIPKLGGRELDLSALYANVTALGGCVQDAAASFHYPETITSVSFTLRKAYIALLWDYEQVYFFRATGPRVLPPASSSPANGSAAQHASAGQGALSNGAATVDGGAKAAPKKKRKSAAAPASGADVVATTFPSIPDSLPLQLTAACTAEGTPEASAVGSTGTVTVDARFDAGYFVSVVLGQRAFRGMLYYPPQEPAQALIGDVLGGQGSDAAHAAPRGWEPPEKKGLGKLNTVPKPNRTPFNFFSGIMRERVRSQHPEMGSLEVTRKVGEMWQQAGSAEKAPYMEISQADKARYHYELEAYNYRLASQAAEAGAEAAAERFRAAQAAVMPTSAPAQQPEAQQQPVPPAQQQQQQQHAMPPLSAAMLPLSFAYPAAVAAAPPSPQAHPMQQAASASGPQPNLAEQFQQHHQQQPGMPGQAGMLHLPLQIGPAAPQYLAVQMQQQQQHTNAGVGQPGMSSAHMQQASGHPRLVPPAALHLQSGMALHGPMGGLQQHQ